MAVLDDLIDELILLPEDRESLKAKRGFPDDVIDRKKWRSCHPDNVRILSILAEKHGLKAMIDEQLYCAPKLKGSEPYPNPQLLERNILIPYRNEKGQITKVRPHWRGFKGQPARVYRTELSFHPAPLCVIAESEFKAEAAAVFGLSAIGIPGIGSMSGKNWDYFESELRSIQAEQFVICFDTEIKDDPNLPNYKPDWKKRYDTTIFSYAMCQKIINAGLSCKIASLPKAWMVNGKIDFDGALAQGHQPAEIFKIITDGVGPKAFLESAEIDSLHSPYVSRRIHQMFFTSKIKIKNNCFYTLKTGKGADHERKLANCSFSIKNIYEEIGTDQAGVRRDLVLVDEYGLESRPTSITATSMASKSAFQQWLMGNGNYLFYGKDEDVVDIWDHVFNCDEGDVVYLSNRCGYIREEKFWLFKDCLIGADGKLSSADDNGITWHNELGYKINPLSDDHSLPSLSASAPFDMDRFVSALGDTVSSDGMAQALIGWTLSIAFLEGIQAKYKLFPLMFLYGNRGSGKTTVMRWLTSFYGQNETVSLAASSPVGITRLLSYYASLPVVVDDWRDDPKSRSFITMFLGVYNRQAGAKGVKSRFGIQQSDVRAALAILGEEMINDNGLATRCLNFYMPMARRAERMEEIEELIPNAPNFIKIILTSGYDATLAKVLASIESAIKAIGERSRKVERRVIINFGIIVGVYNAIIGESDSLLSWIDQHINAVQLSLIAGDKIHTFIDDFVYGVVENQLDINTYAFSADGTKVYLWVSGIHRRMNKYFNRDTGDQTELICTHLKQQPYFVTFKKVSFRGGQQILPCAELDLTKMHTILREKMESVKSVNTRRED